MALKSKKNIIILDKDTIIGKVSDKNEIILTPSFYWVTKRELPIKFTFEAKKYMPSIFEEIAPSGKYSYFAIKEDKEYLLFAYEDRKIFEALEKFGISNVRGIYFAQNELKDFLPFDLENGFALELVDGIVTKVPTNIVKNLKRVENLNIPLKHKITLKRYSYIVDESGVKNIAIALIVLITVFIFESMYFYKESQDIESKAQKVFEKYSLPPTKLQNRAIYSNLNEIAKYQKDLREFLYKITKVSLKSDERVENIDIDGKEANIEIALSNQNRIEYFKNYFLSQNLDIKKIEVYDKSIKVEFSI